jgi:exodeoxyribonuclease-3
MPTLVSWNVNGLRSALGKGLLSFIEQRAPDVLCLQEIKLSDEHVPALALPFAHQYWHHAEKPGYSGTAILSRVKPKRVLRDFPGKSSHPPEGRVLAAEFAGYWLVNGAPALPAKGVGPGFARISLRPRARKARGRLRRLQRRARGD